MVFCIDPVPRISAKKATLKSHSVTYYCSSPPIIVELTILTDKTIGVYNPYSMASGILKL